MAIAVVGMLDEREEGLGMIKQGIEKRGHRVLLMDISMGTGAGKYTLNPDISSRDLILSRGITFEDLTMMLVRERSGATSIMSESLGEKLLELHGSGDLHGVIAVGGATGTMISLPAMSLLPYGFPKVLISSVAGHPHFAGALSGYYGMKDITVIHSVVDTVGMNRMVRRLMLNGAGAVSGMAETYEPDKDTMKPSIAITEYGHCEKGAHHIRALLDKEFSITSFHSTGFGEKAAVSYVNQGLFKAFIDLVPAGFAEHLFGGTRDAGPGRLSAGNDLDMPYIIAPGGFDMIGCGPLERKDQQDPLWESRHLVERRLHVMDSARVEARTSAEEMKTLGVEVADRLNRRKNKDLVKFIIPLRGFSAPGTEGGVLHDAAADRAFIDSVKENLDPEIETIEMDTDINSPAFAEQVARVLRRTINI